MAEGGQGEYAVFGDIEEDEEIEETIDVPEVASEILIYENGAEHISGNTWKPETQVEENENHIQTKKKRPLESPEQTPHNKKHVESNTPTSGEKIVDGYHNQLFGPHQQEDQPLIQAHTYKTNFIELQNKYQDIIDTPTTQTETQQQQQNQEQTMTSPSAEAEEEELVSQFGQNVKKLKLNDPRVTFDFQSNIWAKEQLKYLNVPNQKAKPQSNTKKPREAPAFIVTNYDNIRDSEAMLKFETKQIKKFQETNANFKFLVTKTAKDKPAALIIAPLTRFTFRSLLKDIRFDLLEVERVRSIKMIALNVPTWISNEVFNDIEGIQGAVRLNDYYDTGTSGVTFWAKYFDNTINLQFMGTYICKKFIPPPEGARDVKAGHTTSKTRLPVEHLQNVCSAQKTISPMTA